MNTSLYNNLAIQIYTQTLNNLPVKRYGAIFRHVREDFIDITTRARMCRETHCIGLNLKCWFCQSIKRKTRKQIPPKSGIKIVNYSTNLILQAVLTQPEKDSLSFFACWLICSNRSSSKRICFIVLFERSKSFFSFFSCIGNYQCDRLDYSGSYHCIRNYLKKAIPQSTDPTLRDLTTITLIEVMIMANSYDSACLRAEQSKLFKFYDLSTAQVIQTTATTERQARKNLGKQSLIFIARIRITPIIERARTWGGYSHEEF